MVRVVVVLVCYVPRAGNVQLKTRETCTPRTACFPSPIELQPLVVDGLHEGIEPGCTGFIERVDTRDVTMGLLSR